MHCSFAGTVANCLEWQREVLGRLALGSHPQICTIHIRGSWQEATRGLTTRSKKLLGALGLTSRNKKLLETSASQQGARSHESPLLRWIENGNFDHGIPPVQPGGSS